MSGSTRERSKTARSGRRVGRLSRCRAGVAGQGPEGDGHHRGRDRRIGQQPRGAGRVGPVRTSQVALPFICAGGDGRCRQTPLLRQPCSCSRDSHISLDWRRNAVSVRVQGAVDGRRWLAPAAARSRRRDQPAPRSPGRTTPKAKSSSRRAGREAGQKNRTITQTQIALPFLRFTRDKRGYETTSLVHAGRRGGRSRQRILYWFRTPPGVKVGRPALDEEAIRWIEEHNPDIEFDWPKILEAQPPARRLRRARNRREPSDEARTPRPARAPRPATEAAAARSNHGSAALEDSELELNRKSRRTGTELRPKNLSREAFEQLTHPDAEEKIEPAAMPVEQTRRTGAAHAPAGPVRGVAGAHHRARRRCRARRSASQRQAESLNPDTWVTDEEVRQGIESFEPKIRDLRAALGLRRRRRSRRGGAPAASGGRKGRRATPAELEQDAGGRSEARLTESAEYSRALPAILRASS